MYTVEWDEKKLSSLYKKLNKISDNLLTHATAGIKKACDETQKTALNYKPGSKDPSKIRVECEQEGKTKVKGRVFTDKDNFSYATFLEYGTGALKGPELPVIAQTETYYKSGGTKWYLPVDKSPKPLENPIVYVPVRDKHGMKTGSYIKCYVMTTQAPTYFMTNTAFDRRQPNVETIRQEIQNGMRGDI